MRTTDTQTLGMDSEAIPSDAQATAVEQPNGGGLAETPRNDHFIVEHGQCFAGRHLIVDLWQARDIDDIEHVRATMRRATAAAGATLLHTHFHHFTPNGGVTGVAMLAESHISIHSWPERGYAALDVFMCGDSDPDRAIEVLRAGFQPGEVEVREHKRGRVLPEG